MSQESDLLNILTRSDKEGYIRLRSVLSSERNKYQRFHRIDAFDKNLEQIKNYCLRGDEDDWKRCLVCGICWTGNCICVNVKRLMKTTGKSKSNINGTLSKMGYIVNTNDIELKRELVNSLPFLKGNYLEQRFWTTRINASLTPVPKRESIDIDQKAETKTPQPVRNYGKIPCGDELKSMFGVSQLELGDNECGNYDDNDVDFFSDPVCCCPTEWLMPNMQSNISFA